MNTAVRTAIALAAPFFLAACGDAESNDVAEETTAAASATDDANAKGAAAVKPSDMVLGAPDAEVTVIEFASTTCPHCATFHEEIFPTLKEEYVDTGKVKFVFREFPTPPVEFALIGSVIPRCAAEKAGADAYFLVLGSLFKRQREWIYGDDPKAELLKIASQAGMDEAAFDACLKRQDFVDLVQDNTEAASKELNITSTPSFVINGEKLAWRDIDDFRKALDEALGETPAGEDAANDETGG